MFICPIVCQINMFASGSPSLWLVWTTRNAYALRFVPPGAAQPALLVPHSLVWRSRDVVRRLPSAVRLLATRYWLGQYGKGEVLRYARRLALHNTDAWHGVQSRKYGAWVTGTHVVHECWLKRQRNRPHNRPHAHYRSQGMEQE